MSFSTDALFHLGGKVVVITGAAGLLGREHVQAVVGAGATAVLLDVNEAALQEVVGSIHVENAELLPLCVDITKEKGVSTAGRKVLDRYGKIDALVNNAANNPKVESQGEVNFSRLEHFPLEIWNADIAVGLTGAFLCAKYFGREISKNPQGGVIVNIASDLGLIAPDQRLYRRQGIVEEAQPVKPVTYSVVKAGLIGLTRYLATYWADRNVRCNALCPGGVENGQDPDFIARVESRIPLGRMANKDEYHSTLIWMLSEGAGYLNGAVVPVDGGRTVW